MSKSNANLGGVDIFVTNEDLNLSNQITDKPVEEGANISDHINQDPLTINVAFTVVENAKGKAKQLRELRDAKEVYTYQGVDFSFENMGIDSLNIPRNKEIKDGFSTTMKLKQIKLIKKDQGDITGSEVQLSNQETPTRETQTDNVPQNNHHVDNRVKGA
jgi:hypothetical protein